MAERTIRYSIVWLVFLAVTFTGAALLFSPNPDDDVLGIAVLLSPLVVFGAFMVFYYRKSRVI